MAFSVAQSLARCPAAVQQQRRRTISLCFGSNTALEDVLERQLSHHGASTSQSALTYRSQQQTNKQPPLLSPPLRRPTAPEHSDVPSESATVPREATPSKLAQLAQQLRMCVRAVQDLVARCPKLLALTPEQLEAAVAYLASELNITPASATFMVSKDPHLLFIGKSLHTARCDHVGDGGSSTRRNATSNGVSGSKDAAHTGTSSSNTASGTGASNGADSEGGSISEGGMGSQTQLALTKPKSGGRKQQANSASASSPTSSGSSQQNVNVLADAAMSTEHYPPTKGPAARAATLAQALGVRQEDVVRLATSTPSVLSRPPAPLAAKLKRLADVLGGVPVARVLSMAAEEPSYLTYRPPAVERRIQAMQQLFRKPRHKVVDVLKQQPDLVFMSPRILHNKLKVLQRIFNKEVRLVVPVALKSPKLLRTNMDEVRECYELLEGLMELPSRSYSFAMVCHAPSLLLEGKGRLVGRFRCITHALRGAPHWRKQWKKLYPAERADCMLTTPVTYSRLNFLIATGQARSLHLYDALMMARSDFNQRFPSFKPVPIRRPTTGPTATLTVARQPSVASPGVQTAPTAGLHAPARGSHTAPTSSPHATAGAICVQPLAPATSLHPPPTARLAAMSGSPQPSAPATLLQPVPAFIEAHIASPVNTASGQPSHSVASAPSHAAILHPTSTIRPNARSPISGTSTARTHKPAAASLPSAAPTTSMPASPALATPNPVGANGSPSRPVPPPSTSPALPPCQPHSVHHNGRHQPAHAVVAALQQEKLQRHSKQQHHPLHLNEQQHQPLDPRQQQVYGQHHLVQQQQHQQQQQLHGHSHSVLVPQSKPGHRSSRRMRHASMGASNSPNATLNAAPAAAAVSLTLPGQDSGDGPQGALCPLPAVAVQLVPLAAASVQEQAQQQQQQQPLTQHPTGKQHTLPQRRQPPLPPSSLSHAHSLPSFSPPLHAHEAATGSAPERARTKPPVRPDDGRGHWHSARPLQPALEFDAVASYAETDQQGTCHGHLQHPQQHHVQHWQSEHQQHSRNGGLVSHWEGDSSSRYSSGSGGRHGIHKTADSSGAEKSGRRVGRGKSSIMGSSQGSSASSARSNDSEGVGSRQADRGDLSQQQENSRAGRVDMLGPTHPGSPVQPALPLAAAQH